MSVVKPKNTDLSFVVNPGCYTNDCTIKILACLRLLLGAGADPAVGANGTSPLELVLNRTAPVEVVELLIDHGAHGIFLSE